MTVTDKHVSKTSLAETSAAVKSKMDKLREYVESGKLDHYPGEGFVVDFALWQDSHLGLRKFAKSILYTANYKDELEAIDTLLKKVRAGRHQQTRKAQVVQELQAKLDAAEAKAQSYVDQYTQVAADLEDARKKTIELEQDNADLRARLAKVTPLRRANSYAVPH